VSDYEEWMRAEYERGFAAGMDAAARVVEDHLIPPPLASRIEDYRISLIDTIRSLAPERAERGEGARCGSGAWATCPKGHTNFLNPGDYCPACQPAPPASGAPRCANGHVLGKGPHFCDECGREP
jgi:hypothetical protein